MRKSILIIAGLLAGTAAAPAMAADATGTVDVTAKVAPKCLFTTASQTIDIPELAGADGKLAATTVNNQSKTLVGWCNGSASTIRVSASALTNSAPSNSSFDNVVNYTASAVANNVTATDSTTDAGAGNAATVGLFSGNIVVTLSQAASAGDKLLLAGDYSGAVTVTLSPAIEAPAPINNS